MFGLGAGGGTGASSAGQRGAGVGLTGLVGVEALRDGPRIEAGGDRSGSGVPSAGMWVKGRVLGCAGLGVVAEVLMMLSGWGSSSTILLATQVLVKSDLPVNCRFTYTLDCQMELPL